MKYIKYVFLLILLFSCKDNEMNSVSNVSEVDSNVTNDTTINSDYSQIPINCDNKQFAPIKCGNNEKNLFYKFSVINGKSVIEFKNQDKTFIHLLNESIQELGINSFLFENKSKMILIIDSFLEYGHTFYFYLITADNIKFISSKNFDSKFDNKEIELKYRFNISENDNSVIIKLGNEYNDIKLVNISNSNTLPLKKDNTSENIVDNSINQYLNNNAYFIKTFDVNKDGIDDKIVSSNRYQGDELLIFFGEVGMNFKFVLRTVNFSVDGGNQISDIIETAQGFNIITLFPDKGNYEENYHIIFENNALILKTLETFSTSWQDGYKETCTIKNIDFNLNKPVRELLNVLSKTDKNCVKAKL